MKDTKDSIKNNNKEENADIVKNKENVEIILLETVKSSYENTFSARSSLQSRASTGLVALIALLTIFFTTLRYDIFQIDTSKTALVCLATIYGLIILSIFVVAILAIICFIKRNHSKPMCSIFPIDIVTDFLKGNDPNEVFNDLISSYLQQQQINSKYLETESKKLDKAYIYFSIVIFLMVFSCIIRFIME